MRKYRRTLKRKKSPRVDITTREKIFNLIYKQQISSELAKGKTTEQIAIADKLVKKTLKISSTELIKKSAEKETKKGGDNK